MSKESEDPSIRILFIGLVGALLIVVVAGGLVEIMKKWRDVVQIQAEAEAKKNAGLRPAIRAELNNTFVELPDGTRIYLQSGQEKKR